MIYTTHLLRHTRKATGMNIPQLRMRYHWTLEQLSKRCDLSPNALDRYEMGNGEMNMEPLLRLSCVLGCSIRALIPE